MIRDDFQLVVSTSEQGLYWDVDPHWFDPTSVEKKDGDIKAGWGITFKLRAGDIVYPSNQRVFGKTAWRWYCPVPLPFLSIAIGKRAFYVGFKDFRADSSHAYLGLKDGDRALTPAIRFTRDRSK